MIEKLPKTEGYTRDNAIINLGSFVSKINEIIDHINAPVPIQTIVHFDFTDAGEEDVD